MGAFLVITQLGNFLSILILGSLMLATALAIHDCAWWESQAQLSEPGDPPPASLSLSLSLSV